MRRTFREDVEGAPFLIGQWVRFVGPSEGDRTINKKGVGKIGRVYAFSYEMWCCESYPQDPCIHVSDLPHDWYWQEELQSLSKQELRKLLRKSDKTASKRKRNNK